MLRLKIGQNYLIINYTNSDKTLINQAIPYMMGCFKGTGSIAMALTEDTFNAREVVSLMNEIRAKTLYILEYEPYLRLKREYARLEVEKFLTNKKNRLGGRIIALRTLLPDIKVKVININSCEGTPEFKIAAALLDKLKDDPNNIASSLNKLDAYKRMTKRYAAIPGEIKIIDNDLKKLNKKVAVCDRKDTVETLSYLKLIKSVEKNQGNLRCHLHKLPIYPSEPLGEVFNAGFFQTNPYLFKAASYIYQGYHFEMPETTIEIDTSFHLHFIETKDHRFDNMFKRHNWSRIGYPHFGDGGFCAGEFNDTMAHAKEYGLGYYFTCLRQYLTTANMRDIAGIAVWWYPIYDDNGEMVYCAGVDALLNEYLRREDPMEYEHIKDLSWDEKTKALAHYDYPSSATRYGRSNMNYSYHGADAFLQVCKEQDAELYDKIMKGMKK